MLFRQFQHAECSSALPKLDDDLQKCVAEVFDCIRQGRRETATKITELGIELYCHHTRITPNHDMDWPVTRFLILSSITDDGGLIPSAKVTDVISILQNWTRIFILKDRLEYFAQQDSDVRKNWNCNLMAKIKRSSINTY